MVSVIILTYNGQDMTRECIESVLETQTEEQFEIIIVDNGSDVPFKPPFSGFVETNLIRNEENEGFPVGVNQGIRASRGDTIVLLNDDTVVTPGWMDRMAQWLRDFDIVGPCTNYVRGVQSATIRSYTSLAELEDAAKEWTNYYAGASVDVNFVVGFCMMFQRELYDEIGDFDERLWPCSGEEIDFCLRARKAGYKIGVAYDVYIHHYGSQTFDQMQENGQLVYDEVCDMCDDHLEKTWGKDVWEKQLTEIDYAKEYRLAVNG